ncbi:hypothetical protein HX871_18830 [Pseudomonas reactans]|uniref:Uncharacterized protein n=1 Tax=Pseudomonas reactans TaxID=117680 RepID=A0ABX2QXR9_9PSED|nr:hypothetical protein [Pseudomonas reactans]NWA41103.1 hypothetical protein [Pseudomonas reactans]NWD96482.1 hypothetical protein [Pseudomonas reactans]
MNIENYQAWRVANILLLPKAMQHSVRLTMSFGDLDRSLSERILMGINNLGDECLDFTIPKCEA